MNIIEHDDRQKDLVVDLFWRAVDSAGGDQAFIDHHRLGWLPDLLTSACVLIMQADGHLPPDEIADSFGLTRETVTNILSAPSEAPPLPEALPADEAWRETLSGAVVKSAYQTEHLH